MKQVKICPECNAEYFAHIEKCADCGVVLLLPEENQKVQEEKKRLREKPLEQGVVVSEGELKWMQELQDVLLDSGVASAVTADDGCNKGCCGNTCRLQVSSEDVEKAKDRVEQYYAEVHPEIQASNELASSGKCPACGSAVDADAVECPDCGLILVIAEK
ncbi:MAG TPA: hypothetical protein ENG95_01430 [Nitrospirae bacterium]|nr:hypothetical protein BMS3Abin10_00122 [bacterium BMS3Abin10]GBE39307.1 hypothetical protein BMS3Bbin08_01929 [bacterium BMS3Bbin08]HDH50118.1 hypothetical protein [Nitrospirota bacterium]HDK16349.1 hypothetical protein [Nitrospirota bacterium]HDK81914.1 hypothetical protein [Nitrospirota bacterium]